MKIALTLPLGGFLAVSPAWAVQSPVQDKHEVIQTNSKVTGTEIAAAAAGTNLVGYGRSVDGRHVLHFKEGPAHILRFMDANGQVVRTWEGKNARLSPAGQYSLVTESKKVGGQTIAVIEAIGIDGRTAWKKELVGQATPWILDSGAALVLPWEYGAEFAVYDTRGNRIKQKIVWMPMRVGAYWSPSGKAILLRHNYSPRIQCLTSAGAIEYETPVSADKADSIERAAVWDDCSAVVVVTSRWGYPEASSRMVSVNSAGRILKEVPMELPAPGDHSLATTRDGQFLAYVERGPRILVIDRANLQASYVYEPKDIGKISKIFFGESKDRIFLVYGENSGASGGIGQVPARARNRWARKIRAALRGKEHGNDRAIEVGIDQEVDSRWAFDPHQSILYVPSADGVVEAKYEK